MSEREKEIVAWSPPPSLSFYFLVFLSGARDAYRASFLFSRFSGENA